MPCSNRIALRKLFFLSLLDPGARMTLWLD
uniref:Uncharacterized protein n=1 Tax=Arundo donax TaxID=35708 RepID=A0A0A8YEI3_ARUDO